MRRISQTCVNTDKTLEDAFSIYASEVSIHTTNGDWEAMLIAIAAYEVGGVCLGNTKLCDVNASMIAVGATCVFKP